MRDEIDKVEFRHRDECLMPDEKGLVRLRIVQAATNISLLGKRILPGTPLHSMPTDEQLSACKALLGDARKNALSVISYLPGMGGYRDALKNASVGGAIVTLAGVENQRNVSFIAVDGVLLEQDKFSLSSEDEREGVVPGAVLNVFRGNDDPAAGSAVRWAVLNCHDYTHVEVIDALLRERIELLVVVAHNPASRLYWNYALADVHRLYCYVVIVNTAELGGSAVFAPFRRMGVDANAKYGAGGQLFSSRGPAKFDAELDLDFSLLRKFREDFSRHGFAYIKSEGRGFPVEAMVPSQHFLATGDTALVGAPRVESVHEQQFQWAGSRVRVAVAQLQNMAIDSYIQSGYRLHRSCAHDAFSIRLEGWLKHLMDRLEPSRQPMLDLLVLPEVFVPRGFLPKLQAFSNCTGAVVIAGVDYPDRENANECMVIRPNEGDGLSYRKITRSQYDGLIDMTARMPMNRGDRLLRLVDDKGHGFGVLICYDYSHFDLLARLNREGRNEPLEMIVVVAHNPFGELIIRPASPMRTASINTS